MGTLTSSTIVSAELKQEGWSAKRLLDDIARGDGAGAFHCLIDTGALVTGMDNFEVAEYLLRRLPKSFQGVVYLDRKDQKMILLASGQSMRLADSGVAWKNRFTFYDQVQSCLSGGSAKRLTRYRSATSATHLPVDTGAHNRNGHQAIPERPGGHHDRQGHDLQGLLARHLSDARDRNRTEDPPLHHP